MNRILIRMIAAAVAASLSALSGCSSGTSSTTADTNNGSQNSGGTTNVSYTNRAGDPVLFFTDLDWGPKSGWEGSSSKGAAVTVWGRHFGSSRNGNYILISNGTTTVQLASDSDYAEWDAVGPAQGMERITFWLNNTCPDGNVGITVSVNGVLSNMLSFTIINGIIYFVSGSDGSNSYNGHFASSSGHAAPDGPFRDLYMFNPSRNPSGDGQYIVYVRGGTYSTEDAESAIIALKGPYGGPSKRKALIAYPGEVPVIDTAAATRGIVWVAAYDPYGPIDYLTVSKLAGVNGQDAISLTGMYERVVGCTFRDYLDDVWSGVVWVGSAKYSVIYGNLFDHCGYDSYKHNIYIKTQYSPVAGMDYSTHDIYVGWNEFSNPVASDTHGGAIFVSKSSETQVASYPTTSIFIHSNYFHDGNIDFIYIGDGTAIGDVFVYNNIFKGGTSTSGCMTLQLGTTNVYLYNNDFYQCGATGTELIWQTGYSHSYFKNNIWYAQPGQTFFTIETYQGATMSSDSDLFYDPDDSTAVPSGSGIIVTNSFAENPLFVATGSNFDLQDTSPARDRGTNTVSNIVAADIEGLSRPQGSGFDIGAIEHAAP